MKRPREYPARACSTCGRELVPVDGRYPRHYTRGPSGRRQLCLRSGQNALTPEELGWPRRARHATGRIQGAATLSGPENAPETPS